jgi:CelD/BcsL family acetyltransferase involved in cellulose biosynthesis
MALSLSDPLWTSFVEGHPSATPFHHPAWANVLAKAYGFDAAGLALVDTDGEIEAALPIIRLGGRASRRREVSLPFTDWCPPLVRPGTDSASLGMRLDATRRESRLVSLEVRDRLTGDTGHVAVQGYRHVLALQPDPEAVYEQFHGSRVKGVKGNLRRAEREGVSVRRSDSKRDLMEVFYPLHVTTRRRLGVPVQPRRFFEVLSQDFLEPGFGFVVSAHLGEIPVAAAVVFAWNRRMIYKFSATDRNFGKTGAGQAVIWDALRWGCENGHVDFDLGRTDLGHEGLRSFKRAWGSEEYELAYTILADRPPRPRSGRATNMLGEVIRRSPEIVTRAIGRAAYRYTA